MFHILHIPTGKLVHAYTAPTWETAGIYYTLDFTGTLVSYKYKSLALAMLKIIAGRVKIDPAEFELIHV